jgi:1,3,6,8-tetrahydroxynaphthalene synthase
MATLCKPAVRVPEHVVTMEDMLAMAEQIHAGKPQLPLALRLIRNTSVAKRHIVQPVEATLAPRA